eukprot:6626039-Prymnesium_polylepis.3
MGFEYSTWGGEVAKVELIYWKLRVGAYVALAAPCYLTFLTDGLMPVLLPGILLTIAAAANAAACYSSLPKAKEWKWTIFSRSAEARKKAADSGGKEEGCGDKLIGLCRIRELFEQGLLPRVIFLTWYSALNLAVGLHAFGRHGYSEKGKALRGEAFLGCPREAGQYAEPGIAPLAVEAVCWFTFPCPEPEDGWLCPGGTPPVAVPASDPALLQEFGVGFGWVGYPGAKAFGQLLNLNCAVLLMPVTHSMITKAHDLTSIYGPPWLRWLSFVLPFDKAVVFHKACAKYFLLPCGALRGVLHYFNYGRAPYYNAVLGSGVYPATPREAAWGTSYGGFGLTGEFIVVRRRRRAHACAQQPLPAY